jgi:hypothetical protein
MICSVEDCSREHPHGYGLRCHLGSCGELLAAVDEEGLNEDEEVENEDCSMAL